MSELHPLLKDAVGRGILTEDGAAALAREAATAGVDVAELLARRGLEATTQGGEKTLLDPMSRLERTGTPGPMDRTVLAPKKHPLEDSGRLKTGLFGRYQVLGEIARGGVGIVYRARQIDADRTVALKVLLAGDFASELDERRFLREAETAAQLHHPNIVGVFDIGREHGRLFYTMELVDGKPLGLWGKGKPLDEKLRVFAKACRAVHVAHMKGVIHRDLKPGNILVTPEGEPKVLDFGLAKLARPGADTLSTMTGQTVGTPFYMSPEQAAGRVHDIDLRSDVWALGVILFELVTGGVPFPGRELTEVLAKIENDDPVAFVGPPDLRLVASKALEKERSRRYPSAEALAEDIDRFLAGERVSARPPSVAYLAKRWVRRHPASSMGAAVALAAALSFGGWQLTRPGRLRFDVTPASAGVTVDGKAVTGEAEVSAGRHRVEVSAGDFRTASMEVDVGRGETRSLAFRLEHETGTLRLDSDEPGTIVVIRGERHGLPFLDERFPTGPVTLVFRAKGFETRERQLTVRAGQETSAWVSMVSTGFLSATKGNTFEAPVRVADMDGDGALDVTTLSQGDLYRLDGRAGGVARFSTISNVVCIAGWSAGDWDGDTFDDDIIVANNREGVFVAVLSGREAAPRVPGGIARPQKALWARKVAESLPGEAQLDPAVVTGRELWVPMPGSILRFALGAGTEIPALPSPAGARPHLLKLADGSGVLAFVPGEIRLLANDGSVEWTASGPEYATLAVRQYSEFAPRRDGLVFLSNSQRATALRVSSGEKAWSVPRQENSGGLWIADGAPEAPSTLYSPCGGTLSILDGATGRHRGDIDKSGSRGEGLTATDSAVFLVRDTMLFCFSSADGSLSWKATLPAPVPTLAASADTPAGPEFAYTTSEGLLVTVAGGKVTREVQVGFTPRQTTLRHLDADGRPDALLVGYGLQLVRSSRILWKRRGTNAMRPRPVAFRRATDALPTIFEISRWDGDASGARAFDAATGEIVWSVRGDYDVMHEPALRDVDGDGVLDVLTQKGNRTPEFVALSGRDGRQVAAFPIQHTPYPPAVFLGDGPDFVLCLWAVGMARHRFDSPTPVWVAPSERAVFGRPMVVASKRLIVTAPAAPTAAEGLAVALDFDGKEAWTTPVPDLTWGPPFPLDTDGDGKPEIAVPGRFNMFILDDDGHLRATWTNAGGTVMEPVAVPGGIVTGTRGGVARLKADGTVLWRYAADYVGGALGVAKLPGSANSAVVGIDWSGRFFCIDLETGAERWRFETGARCEHGVTLCDADGDGVPEAYFGSDDFTVYAVDLR